MQQWSRDEQKPSHGDLLIAAFFICQVLVFASDENFENRSLRPTITLEIGLCVRRELWKKPKFFQFFWHLQFIGHWLSHLPMFFFQPNRSLRPTRTLEIGLCVRRELWKNQSSFNFSDTYNSLGIGWAICPCFFSNPNWSLRPTRTLKISLCIRRELRWFWLPTNPPIGLCVRRELWKKLYFFSNLNWSLRPTRTLDRNRSLRPTRTLQIGLCVQRELRWFLL